MATNMSLDRRAYVGAPHGVAHVWPDYVDWSARPHWSFDEVLRTRAKAHRKKPLTAAQQEVLNKLLNGEL